MVVISLGLLIMLQVLCIIFSDEVYLWWPFLTVCYCLRWARAQKDMCGLYEAVLYGGVVRD
jgi:hypothetical protein